MLTVSSSIPRKINVVDGPSVFSPLIGTPKTSHIDMNWCKANLQIEESGGPKNRKSSKICSIVGTPNFVHAIHCKAVLNVSKMEQDIEHPIGNHLS